jgi:hypothetical protein
MIDDGDPAEINALPAGSAADLLFIAQDCDPGNTFTGADSGGDHGSRVITFG